MSENRKYILANIQLPLEILENGEVKYHNEKASVSFEEISELPENASVDSQLLLSKLFNVQSEPEPEKKHEPEVSESESEAEEIKPFEPEKQILIYPNEIKLKRGAKHNTSFKNKSNNSKRFTAKNYD